MDVNQQAVQAYWRQFVRAAGLDEHLSYQEAFMFCSDIGGTVSDAFLLMVLTGQKTLITSCLPSYEYEGLALPQAGTYSIIADGQGEPQCVIRIEEVRIMPFQDVPYELCKLEGQDDDLPTWRRNHEYIFREEGRTHNFIFNGETPVVLEFFKVVHRRLDD